MDKQRDFVLRTIEERGVKFIRLWFTDVVGALKMVAITPALRATPNASPICAAGGGPACVHAHSDSASHAGHSGHDGSGESHFTIEIESAAFAGESRLNRPRMVNKALGDLPGERVHAMAIKTRAPGE